jgi:tripartite-type tricarboxylate transporter receptor subunit TctC
MVQIFLKRAIALCVLASAWAASPVHAQSAYPNKPIKWVVGYPAGGGSDFLARTVGSQMAEQLRQPVVIDNKPGAAGMIGADLVAKSPGDGYTVFTGDNGILVYNPLLYKTISYNPEKDFAALGLVARVPLILVASAGAGVSDLNGAVSAIRAAPTKFSYASPGSGSPHHLAMELFKQQAKVFATHIPYRGAAPAMQDVMGNQVPLMVVDASTGMPHIKSGKLIPLMTFAAKRLSQLPSVPAAREAGYRDVEAYAWQGLLVPASTSEDIRSLLSREMQAAVATPAVRKKLVDAGWEPNPSDANLMTAYMALEKRKWEKLIRERGIRVD